MTWYEIAGAVAVAVVASRVVLYMLVKSAFAGYFAAARQNEQNRRGG